MTRTGGAGGRLVPFRVVAAVVGVAMFVVAVRYTAMRSIDVRPTLWVKWWVAAAVIHDVVVAPLAIVVGWVAIRFAPRAAKAPVQTALILTAVVVAVAWPALRGYGRNPSNPSYLPRNYGTGLALSLALVWLACAAWTVARLLRSRQVDHAA